MEKKFEKGQIVRSEAYGEGEVIAIMYSGAIYVKYKTGIIRYTDLEAEKLQVVIIKRKEKGKITSQKLEANGFELNHRNSLSKHIGKIIVEMPEDGKFFLYSEESTNTHVLYINTFEQLEEAVNFLNKNEL